MIEEYSLSKYIWLDIAAMKALNILPQQGTDNIKANSETQSIYQLINKTKTSIGTRCLKRWIKQPIRDINELNRWLDVVEFFVEEEKNRNTIQNDHLKTFPDIDKLFAKFYKVKNNKRHNANLTDCVKTYDMLSSLDNLYQFLMSLDLPEDHWITACFTSEIKRIFGKFERLKEMIEESIDVSKVKDGEYIINPEFNEDLKVLNKEVHVIYEKI